MNITGLIDIKEKLAVGQPLTPTQRDFVLQCINEATGLKETAAVLHNPDNYMGRVDKMWAFLSVDDGGEGLCAGPLFGPGTLAPLVCVDRKHLDKLREVAKKIATMSGKPVRLAKFTGREDIGIIEPNS